MYLIFEFHLLSLTELRENGLMNFWDTWFRPIPPQCAAHVKGQAEKEFGKESEKNHGLRRLSLRNLTGAFVVLFIGVGLSFVAFIYEHTSAYIRARE